MKYLVAALTVLSLVFASTASAHHPVGSASQVCEDGTITLTGLFENPGFDTDVTATDSGGLVLPAGTSPYNGSASTPGPSREGGTVTFNWSATDGDEGTLEASYEAVADCEGVPVTPPPDNTPPPENPPQDIVIPGGPNHSPPPSPDKPAAEQPADTLPLTGAPVAPVLFVGLGLLGAGISLRRLSRG